MVSSLLRQASSVSSSSALSSALGALLAHLRAERYAFITVTPLTHERVLRRAGIARDLRGIFGWNRPFDASLLPAVVFEALAAEGLVERDGDLWKSKVRVSTLYGDLFVHSAFPTVAADSVFFGPDTYRFARIIRDHLRRRPQPINRIVDIGCGSGAGGIVAARHLATCELWLTDINNRALEFARDNAAAAGMEGVRVANSDLLQQIDGDFDLIVANPPYLNDELGRTYRHGGGELGSLLSLKIARCALTRLTPGGSLLLYTGAPIVDGEDRLRSSIERLFAPSDLIWDYDEIDPDVFGEELDNKSYNEVDRIAAVVMTAQRPGERQC